MVLLHRHASGQPEIWLCDCGTVQMNYGCMSLLLNAEMFTHFCEILQSIFQEGPKTDAAGKVNFRFGCAVLRLLPEEVLHLDDGLRLANEKLQSRRSALLPFHKFAPEQMN